MLISFISRVPEGLKDVSFFPKLVAELLRRGYSDEEASKLVGKNLITAMEKMEKVKQKTCPYLQLLLTKEKLEVLLLAPQSKYCLLNGFVVCLMGCWVTNPLDHLTSFCPLVHKATEVR